MLDPRGHVIVRHGDVIVADQHNLILDSFFEGILRALTSPSEQLESIVLANSSGAPVQAAMRFVPGAVAYANIDYSTMRPVLTPDVYGRKSILTVTGTLTPTVTTGYDTIGLALASGLVIAATNVGSQSLTAGTAFTTQWVISTAGA